MAVYQITTPDGSVYRITGPENARQEDLIRAVQKQTQEDKYAKMRAEIEALRQPIPAPPVEPTVGGQVKEAFKGIIPGAAGLVETAGAGIAALLPEDLEKSARAKLKEIATSISEPFAAAPGYEDTIGRNIGQGLGSTLPFFALGPLGMAGRAAAAGLGVSAGAGEARQAAEAKGVTGEDRALATALGAPVGVLDIIAPELKIGKNIITRAFLRGGVEGATEAAQKVAQNLIAKGVYDPSQPILAGSGEEGAYGAGVGALASFLVDMTVGRRGRRGRGPISEAGQEAPISETGLPPTATQGDLFPGELRTAETAVMPPAPPPVGTQGKLFSPEEAPVPEAAPVAEVLQEGQGDLFATPPAEETRTMEQPDLVDRAETAQIEDMMRVEKMAPGIAAKNEAEIQRVREADTAKKEQERLKFESDLAELDGRLKATETKNAEDRRLALLLPIIEDSKIKNIPGAFKGELVKAGYPTTQFTAREKNLMRRAYDVRKAEEVPVEAPPVISSGSTAETEAQLEGEIKEKQAKVRQPEQLQLPGVPKPKVPAAVEEQPTAPTPLAARHFDILGIVKAAPLRQRLEGKDFSVAEDRALIQQELNQYMQNPKIAVGTRNKIKNLLASPLFKEQGEMFGPKGGVLKPVVAKETKNVPAAKLEPTPVRVSPPSAGPRVGDSTERAAAPTSTGVGGPSGLAGKPKAGEKVQPTALKEEKPSKPKEVKPTEQKEEKPTVTKSPVQKQAADNYMAAAQNDKAKAIDYLAADIYNASYPQKNEYAELRRISTDLLAGKMPSGIKFGTEGDFIPGTGGKFGKAFYESLSEADQAALIKRLEHYFVTTEAKAKSTLEQINAQQRLARANKETVEPPDEFDLLISAELTRPLHPAAIDALIEGNILEALRMVSNQSLGRASTIAGKLVEKIGAVKVEFVKDLKNESGISVAGMYDPKTNTIRLDESAGANVHTLLHEAVHTTTSHVLANKAHPVTKQLTQLYNDVKGWLDTAYGATSLDEFVSEAMSNPEFQAKLQAINPKGDKITAWQRFVNTVGNFLRSMVGISTKPLGSALDVTDGLVMSILSTSPTTRNAGVLYSMSAMGNSKDIFSALDERYKDAPSWGTGVMDRLKETISSGGNKVLDFISSTLPVHAVSDMASEYLPSARKVPELIDLKSGAENELNESIEVVLTRVERWAKGAPEKLKAFNTLVYGSTIVQVDPYKSRDEYKGKTGKVHGTEINLEDQWVAMQPYVKTLGADGKKIYEDMRNTYERLYNKIVGVINARIDDATEDKKVADAIKKEIYSRLVARGGLSPYFPLTREGPYWLSYHYKGEYYEETFETKSERERASKEFAAEGATNIEKYAKGVRKTYRSAPPTSFVNSVLRTLEVNKVDSKVADEVMELFLSSLPETSFAQAFRARKGTLGFSQDAISALRRKTNSIARQLTNMEYGAKLDKLAAEINEEFVVNGSDEKAKFYLDALSQHIDFAKSPVIPSWAKIAKGLTFPMTLGYNVSSAVVNTAQIPLVVAPYLGGEYGPVKTTKALAHATRVYSQSGFSRKVESILSTKEKPDVETIQAAPSLDNYDFDAKNTPEEIKRLKPLAMLARKRGQLNRSQLYDVLEVPEKGKSTLDVINAASGFLMHHGERMNRQVTMIAAYNLELDRMKAAGRTIDESAMEKAAENAIYIAELTNGGTSAAAAPRIAQSGLGSVMFMFKRYGTSMNYVQFKLARIALKSADKKTRIAAMSQLAGIAGSAALFAGVRGLPMFGMIAMLYNLFKDDDEEDFEVATRKFLGEGKYSGLLNATTGLDISSRIGLSDLIFRDQKNSESTTAISSLMEVMGGPVVGVANRMERGLKLIGEGQTERGIEAMLPSAISNMLKAHRYATEGTTTLRGDPITGDVGPWNVFAQAFGFAPAEYTRQLEINAVEKGIDKATNEKKTKLLRQFYIATRFGDTPTAQEALQKLIKLQQKHPGLGIDADTIITSMKQHAKTSATMYHGITLSKGMRNELLEDAREFDEGYGDIENPFGEE